MVVVERFRFAKTSFGQKRVDSKRGSVGRRFWSRDCRSIDRIFVQELDGSRMLMFIFCLAQCCQWMGSQRCYLGGVKLRSPIKKETLTDTSDELPIGIACAERERRKSIRRWVEKTYRFFFAGIICCCLGRWVVVGAKLFVVCCCCKNKSCCPSAAAAPTN
jgi:hypothetical protein